MISRRVVLAGLLGASLPTGGLAQRVVVAPSPRDDGWPVADPASAGLDPEALAELVEFIDEGVSLPNVHAILVAHDGRLVFEQYWPGEDGALGHVAYGPTTLHDIRSISKSVTALLLGIALGASAEDVVAQQVSDFFPDRGDLGHLEGVTLEHVLTMTAGLAWNATLIPYTSENNFIQLMSTDDPVGFVLGQRMQDIPGRKWRYNSGLTELTAAVIEHLTGQPLKGYADEVLFGPLGITDYEWWRPPAWPKDGFPSASAGLRLRARDLAKIATLTLQGGLWQGRRIVPEAWISEATSRRVDNPSRPYGYGYFWYRGRLFNGHGTIRASGYGDQDVFLLPNEKLAITIYAGNYASPNWSAGERIAVKVLRALR